MMAAQTGISWSQALAAMISRYLAHLAAWMAILRRWRSSTGAKMDDSNIREWRHFPEDFRACGALEAKFALPHMRRCGRACEMSAYFSSIAPFPPFGRVVVRKRINKTRLCGLFLSGAFGSISGKAGKAVCFQWSSK